MLTTEDFNKKISLINESVITSIKMQINRICKDFENDEVREINFNETNLGYSPIYRDSNEDFNTLTFDSVSLDENEKLSFNFSSEIQNTTTRKEEDLELSESLSLLNALENIY